MSTASMNEYIECRADAAIVNHVIEYKPLVADYFKEQDITQALKIIFCESSGKKNAKGRNRDGTEDIGIWQFNDRTWAWLKPKLGIISDRTDAVVSTKVAAWLVYNDGWHHWNSSKSCWKGTNNALLQYKER
jgi:hypothetical protein|tara:strand:+ start:6596 stop:6991 length:396 start_codon:yes stop_codon:yes gene_type:complete